MAKVSEKDIAKKIYEYIGGPENTKSVMNCMTRVRVELKDSSKADIEKLRKIPGVMGVVDGPQIQIVTGPGLSTKVANEMGKISNIEVKIEGETDKDKADRLAREKKKKLNQNRKGLGLKILQN